MADEQKVSYTLEISLSIHHIWASLVMVTAHLWWNAENNPRTTLVSSSNSPQQDASVTLLFLVSWREINSETWGKLWANKSFVDLWRIDYCNKTSLFLDISSTEGMLFIWTYRYIFFYAVIMALLYTTEPNIHRKYKENSVKSLNNSEYHYAFYP